MLITNRRPATHIAFSDESCWNTNQFRSISLVTCSYDDFRILNVSLSKIIEESKHKEIKWSSITETTGIRLIDFVFSNLHKLRVDVIVWNMEDSRHKGILKRDDTEDFCRMYFHLIRNVLHKRWTKECKWVLHPDEHDCVRWSILEKHLNDKSWGISDTIHQTSIDDSTYSEYYNIVEFTPATSKDNPFIQLADVFAGLGTYSYQSYDKYDTWKDKISDQCSIFDTIDNQFCERLSRNDLNRFPVLQHLISKAKSRTMRISYHEYKGLKSFDSNSRINFWLYTPQSVKDMAPIR